MTSTTRPFALLDIFTTPTSIFNDLVGTKKWSWVALFTLLLAFSVSSYFFYDGMSAQWIVEQQLIFAGDMSDTQRQSAEIALQKTVHNTALIGAVSAPLFQLLIVTIFSGYFMLISKTVGTKSVNHYKYSDWFSFTTWTQMPTLVNIIGFIVLFSTSASPDLPLSLVNYASLNQIVTEFVQGDSLYFWAESISLFYLWSIAISAIGLKLCCAMPWSKALLFSLLPYLLIFGLWLLLI
ncbi:MAG: hypothetical protein GY951_05415 [Psychromonas sp.]|nr:hypothetical protein [Alteromonadales bacterium]MCP5077479.1 hypothetical protein [Psychromonas sp.]